MSSSTSKPRFVLDENVKVDVCRFLRENSFDVKVVPKGISDARVAEISKSEKRVLVTNDADFIDPSVYSENNIFAVVLLKIPQADLDTLIRSFSLYVLKMASDDLQGKLFELTEAGLASK